jgi:hypothetical protein
MGALACGSGGGEASGGETATATTSQPIFASDFNGFCSWSSAPATAANDAADGVHGLGPLTVYWNQPPPHGAHAFPVGTLVVKESQETDVTKRTVFAMGKTGGGYNGGNGWEWFSLAHNADCTVTLLWSGPMAPANETYAGVPVGDCNGCHATADNDMVWDTALQLANF